MAAAPTASRVPGSKPLRAWNSPPGMTFARARARSPGAPSRCTSRAARSTYRLRTDPGHPSRIGQLVRSGYRVGAKASDLPRRVSGAMARQARRRARARREGHAAEGEFHGERLAAAARVSVGAGHAAADAPDARRGAPSNSTLVFRSHRDPPGLGAGGASGTSREAGETWATPLFGLVRPSSFGRTRGASYGAAGGRAVAGQGGVPRPSRRLLPPRLRAQGREGSARGGCKAICADCSVKKPCWSTRCAFVSLTHLGG